MSIEITTIVRLPREQNADSNETEQILRFLVVDKERNLTMGVFRVSDYLSEDAAFAAAKECKARHEENPWLSPFIKHRSVLQASYGTAQKLATLTLSLYNGNAYPFAAHSFRGMDEKHLEIAFDLIRSYNRHGEGDDDFMNVARELSVLRDGHDQLIDQAAEC